MVASCLVIMHRSANRNFAITAKPMSMLLLTAKRGQKIALLEPIILPLQLPLPMLLLLHQSCLPNYLLLAPPSITPEAIQQMIINVFSALGISGSSGGESDREGA
eukprot:TRINITY_DN5737_c1_g1_i3.p1 TRINITY_DN5737_c1_g1~~TRINITY_DN5737_c1_g1_i3.p1  ORF type:complete len:105 (-),score=16.90 TRINITY_DN5737_c1_g1_i3:37-351(-)